MDKNFIDGFSRMNRAEKVDSIKSFTSEPDAFSHELDSFLHPDPELQKVFNAFSENTLSNFPLPYGIAPNFRINNESFHVPMVIEESSVVAAASAAAKFWYRLGGFQARVPGTTKSGQIYFNWKGEEKLLREILPELKQFLLKNLVHLSSRMESRGGGVTAIRLEKVGISEPGMYKLDFDFLTADSMGANFINSILEESTSLLQLFLKKTLPENAPAAEPLMSILSNYTPGCTVKVWCQADVKTFENAAGTPGLANRIVRALEIAKFDVRRAVTHNKGIFNGIDAVLMATGNDYRAVEAGAHAYASRTGKYSSLSAARIENGEFIFELELPLALGTVGGLTRLHPLAKWSLDLLGNPGAEKLMMIVAAAGLANNYSAVKSLVTTGIQKGHMKLHLENILNFLRASDDCREKAIKHFSDKTVSYADVEKFLEKCKQV